MMLVRGSVGASVELHAHHIVIRRRGFWNAMRGIGGEKSIPISSITSVLFKQAGFLSPGHIGFSVQGESKHQHPKRDPNFVLFHEDQASTFSQLRDAIQAAINIPSLAALAADHVRNRSELNYAPERDRSGMGRTVSSGLLLEKEGGARSTHFDPNSIEPLNPTVPGWWSELSLRMRIFLIAVLLTGALVLGINPFKPVFGPISPGVFLPSVLITRLALLVVMAALVTRLLSVGISERLVSRATRMLKYSAVAIVLSVPVTVMTRSRSAESAEPPREIIIENSAEATNESAAAEPIGGMPATNAAPSNWTGKYDGVFDGATGTVEITRRPDRRLSVSIAMAGERCAGGIDAVVDQPDGDVITIAKAPYEDRDDQESACRLRLRMQGSKIVLHEEDVCMNHHGVSCGFDGSADRIKERER